MSFTKANFKECMLNIETKTVIVKKAMSLVSSLSRFQRNFYCFQFAYSMSN